MGINVFYLLFCPSHNSCNSLTTFGHQCRQNAGNNECYRSIFAQNLFRLCKVCYKSFQMFHTRIINKGLYNFDAKNRSNTACLRIILEFFGNITMFVFTVDGVTPLQQTILWVVKVVVISMNLLRVCVYTGYLLLLGGSVILIGHSF